MNRRTSMIVVVAASFTLTCAIVRAQNQSNRTGANMSSMSQGNMQSGQQVDQQIVQQLQQAKADPKTAGDKCFAISAGMSNQWEIAIGRQAEQKSQNQQAKELGQRLVQDHQKAQQELEPVAQQLGVKIPQGLTEVQQAKLQVLEALPADQFDKEFAAMEQAQHAAALIEFRTAEQLSQNTQLKQYAQQQIPVLSQHYELAQQTALALGLPGNGPEAIPAAGKIQGTSGNPRNP